MRGAPFNPQGAAGVLQKIDSSPIGSKRKKGGIEGLEPRSVLDNRRSPSPPTSTSTLSSSLGGGAGEVAAVSGSHPWPEPLELQPIADPLMELGLVGGEDWEAMLTDSTVSPAQEQTFLRWITRDADEASSIGKQQQLLPQNQVGFDNGGGLGFGLFDPGFGFEPLEEIVEGGSSVSSSCGFSHQRVKAPSFGNPMDNPIFPPPPINNLPLPPASLPPSMFFQEPMVEKPQLFTPAPHLNPSLFLPLPGIVPPQLEIHQISPKISFGDCGEQNLFLRRNQQQIQGFYHQQQRPMKQRDETTAVAAAHHHHQALVDQLIHAAELVEAGNSVGARGILARLNHQLPSPVGKPLLRSAFYFKEALHRLLAGSEDPLSTPLVTQIDVVLKLSAYKAFSEVSPILQFANFTCTQVLLEELGASDRIHIVDFDIGVGGQWSSFMQELAHTRPASTPLLKITAFVTPCAHHHLELHLTRENLSCFAGSLKIPFEFTILSLDSFDPASLRSDGAIAVNLPVGSLYNPPFSTLLRLVKQLSPKIVVSVDQGCDRSDLQFSHHFLHGLQSYTVLLDSIDAVGTSSDVASKIERFLLQPRIESSVMGRHRGGDKMPPWRTLFSTAGFVQMHFSNFTEAQAECLLKRVQVRGFHLEKRQASLFLHWQHRELASVSAWRC